MKNQNINLAVAALFAALLTSGCATAPVGSAPVKEDKVAQTKSQVYLENTSFVLASGQHASCSVPAGAEKPQAAVMKDGVSTASKDWKDLVSRASGCVSEKNWSKLETLATIIARNDMDSPWGAYFFSVAAEGQNDYSRAIWMSELAQKKAGGRAGLFFYQRGHVLYSMKETNKAMADMEKAISIEPGFVEAHLYLAQIYHRDQQLDKADKHYQAAIAADPKNYVALSGEAECKLRLGANAEAADYYQRAVQVSAREIQPWLRLAFIYETLQKNPEQALNTYRSLKSGLDSGNIKGRADFDLSAKIKALEQQAQPRIPAQAKLQSSAAPTQDEKRSKK